MRCITIDKRMIVDKGVPQSGDFCREIGIQILPAECYARLSNRRFQRTPVSNTPGPARLRNNLPVKPDYLLEIQQSHQDKRP
uniref:Uncharacterized protein n=1 Tax=Candidatus Kentrum sp. FW TaxID=2126338 RepID=A0A450SS76_9GAMM|nr:MAG: hypothetical protein BECKFW1821B_GA0114236_10308 [Candidatus Kentron sp. FW]